MAALPRVPFGLALLYRLICSLRRRVDRFEVLGEDQRARLHAIGIRPERIELKRDPSPVRIDGSEAPLPRPAALHGKTVLLYSGNWGVAHEVDTFVDGYIRHYTEGRGCVGLWLNAVGRGADEVERRLRAASLPIARTCPVPLEELPRLLVTPHAHLITLKDAFVGYALPSKVHGCIASGRPVLFVGSERSDVHHLCEQALAPERYRRVGAGDPDALAAALEQLAGQEGSGDTRASILERAYA
jgi:hypothetical protein